MSDHTLSRRQLIALLGGGPVAAAIIGEAQTNSNGNLYGGTANNMPDAKKVGERTWKGPVSVRSTVPEENGNTFIQTDAGPENNQFAFHHYNNGWGKQGLDVSLLSATGLSVQEGRGLIGLPNHHVNYGSGKDNVEITRFSLASGDVLELWRLESRLKNGGSDSNVSVEVVDETNNSVLGSVTAGSRIEGGANPIGTSGAGATIIARISTGSSAVDLCNSAITSVVSE